MIVILLGKPGSGKGTQAKSLAQKFGLFYFSTGDFSRELARHDARIDELINKKGLLIPEAEMTRYVSDYLEKKVKETKDILFDGYPRFLTQYQFLEKWLKEKGLNVDAIFLLDLKDAEVVKRLSGRRKDPQTGKIYNLVTSPKPGPEVDVNSLVQREDDKPAAIKRRLAEFAKNTQPLIDFLGQKKKLVRIDANRSIAQIKADLVSHLRVLQ